MRVPPITSKANLPEDKHQIFDTILKDWGKVDLPFSLFLYSPEVAGRLANLGTYIRSDTILPLAVREPVILTVARDADCAFLWALHAGLARQGGVREEVIDVIAHRRPLDGLTEEETLLISFGRELLHAHRLSDATFEAAKARYGLQGVTELTSIIGYYSMLAFTLNAFEAEPPPNTPRLP